MEKQVFAKNIIGTILGKAVILLLNFGTVIYTTRFWGAEGKGILAIFAADVDFLAILANILTGSSVAYYLNKVGVSKLYFPACFWAFLVAASGAFFFYLSEETAFALCLFAVSLFTGWIAFHSSLFIGSQKIKYYNVIVVLQPLLRLGFMILFYLTIEPSYFAYLYGQIVSLLVCLCIAQVLSRKAVGKMTWQWDMPMIKKSFSFGFKVELSNFLQFLNYRLGFYVLGYFVGNTSVGIFSIGVTLSESIWIISRSISMVQYSSLIKENNREKAKKETVSVSLYSLYASLACLGVLLVLPAELYTWIFGSEFSAVKNILLWMSPGILALAFSNVYGHYFSAFGQLRILIVKSAIGMVTSTLLAFFFIPIIQISGACIASSGAHIASSLVILYHFFILKK